MSLPRDFDRNHLLVQTRFTRDAIEKANLVNDDFIVVTNTRSYSNIEEDSSKDVSVLPAWRTPATMLAALFTGVLLGVGHHCFNQHLHLQLVSETLLSQTWVSRIDTAFAFLVRTALVVSVIIAYEQRQWTIPLAAVVTPGTLIVEPYLLVRSLGAAVPQLRFSTNNALNYVSNCYTLSINTTKKDPIHTYIGPSANVSRIAWAAATSDNILPIAHAYPNMSYTLTFLAPALSCATVDHPGYSIYFPENHFELSFAAFVPTEAGVIDARNLSCGNFNSLDRVSRDAATIYVFNYLYVAKCQLFEANYSIDFLTEGDAQSVNVKSRTLSKPIATFNSTIGGTSSEIAKDMAYQAIMDAFGTLLVGQENGFRDEAPNPCSNFRLTSINWSNTTTFFMNQMEELFTNITLSMLSSSTLSPPDPNETVSITSTTWPSTYIYKPLVLYIAYGLGIVSSVFCRVVGLLAIRTSGAIYSNKFSTFLRAVRGDGIPGFGTFTGNDMGVPIHYRRI